MTCVRPVAATDCAALLELANLAGVGLTTLPKDSDLLKRRIDASIRSFEKNVDRPGGETYLFVMEDLGSQRVIGACGIVSKVGGFQPFYSYRVATTVFESMQIGVRKEVPILTLFENHDGPCEIGSLFLHPDFRRDGNGRFLQLVRFLFIAEHPDWFESTVVSEIRGVTDSTGESPFWNAIGRHFFGIDFAEADRLSIINKKFIADLMPDHPIYIPLLPRDAQSVIGRPHPASTPAVKNLASEGFAFANEVDIFDAGPVFSCPRDSIRSIRDSQRKIITAIVENETSGSSHMISNVAGNQNFRACVDHLSVKNNGVVISKATAAALSVDVGDSIRFVSARAANGFAANR